MWSRIVSMCHFRMSPIDTMPARRSFSSTGMWRNLPFVIRSITLLIEIVDVTCKDVSRHRLLNRQVMNGASAFRHHADDVALRQNASEAPADPKDHQRSDTMLGEQFGRGGKIGSKIDAHDLAALCGKNGLQAHVGLRQGPLRTNFMVVCTACLSRHVHSISVRFRSKADMCSATSMSALGHKQTCAPQNVMSALPPKATSNATNGRVRMPAST